MDDDQHPQPEPKQQFPTMEDMIACVDELEAALLPCLTDMEPKAAVPDYEAPLWTYISDESMAEQEAPATELQDTDDCTPPPVQGDMDKYARDFMAAAKKLQRYFISLQSDHHQPTRGEILRKEIAGMEEELKKKNEMIQKQERLIQHWKLELKDRLDQHNAELKRM